jgi:hypothetical protein
VCWINGNRHTGSDQKEVNTKEGGMIATTSLAAELLLEEGASVFWFRKSQLSPFTTSHHIMSSIVGTLRVPSTELYVVRIVLIDEKRLD